MRNAAISVSSRLQIVFRVAMVMVGLAGVMVVVRVVACGNPRIGAAQRYERPVHFRHRRAESFQHLPDDVVAQNPNAVLADFRRQMTVSDVPGQFDKVLGSVSLNVEDVLRRSLNPDPAAVVKNEPVAVAQHDRFRQVDQRPAAVAQVEDAAPHVPRIMLEHDHSRIDRVLRSDRHRPGWPVGPQYLDHCPQYRSPPETFLFSPSPLIRKRETVSFLCLRQGRFPRNTCMRQLRAAWRLRGFLLAAATHHDTFMFRVRTRPATKRRRHTMRREDSGVDHVVTCVETEVPLGLLRLTSSLLPVGAFAYSRGLEHAAQAGWVTNTQDVGAWIFGTLEHAFAALDAPLFLRMMDALDQAQQAEFLRLDALLSASRESRELLQEDRRMAAALLDLLRDLDVSVVTPPDTGCQTFAAAFAHAVHDMGATPRAGLSGLMWSVCEAQVAAAIRLGLIGQTDGQRILVLAPDVIARCACKAQAVPADEIGNLSFMLAVGSALHEEQYSRLFAS